MKCYTGINIYIISLFLLADTTKDYSVINRLDPLIKFIEIETIKQLQK
jgi:hypothetical protein